jgi:hypothetical protein
MNAGKTKNLIRARMARTCRIGSIRPELAGGAWDFGVQAAGASYLLSTMGPGTTGSGAMLGVATMVAPAASSAARWTRYAQLGCARASGVMSVSDSVT